MLQLSVVILGIKLHNFRSYELYEARLNQQGVVIVGPNGTGKTNLLEAIYIALRGSSWRGPLSDTIRVGTNQATLLLETPNETRRIQFTRDGDRIDKSFIVNDSRSKVLTQKHRLPVVLFEPDELRLISSSPTRRREFLDSLISRLDPQFERQLRALNRTLLQRNELLKNHQTSRSWQDHLFAWDIKFVQLAKLISEARANFLYGNESQLSGLYTSLAGSLTDFTVEYLPSVDLENYEQLLLNRLQNSREYEIATGHTATGPHREDFQISLHSQPASKVASRGEMRTIMLAFKILELELQAAQSKTKPIILLDDVFSELDSTREQLLQEVIRSYQSIVTTTDTRHGIVDESVISTS